MQVLSIGHIFGIDKNTASTHVSVKVRATYVLPTKNEEPKMLRDLEKMSL